MCQWLYLVQNTMATHATIFNKNIIATDVAKSKQGEDI